MQILFVISATFWSWLVGRAIVFGPTTRSVCWYPNMHSDTWYRLTPLPCVLSQTYFALVPLLFAAAAIPVLFVPDDNIHILTVLRLTLEHAYVPLFTAHVHSEYILTLWPNVTAAMAVLSITLMGPIYAPIHMIACASCIASIAMHTWFVRIQIHILLRGGITRTEEPYECRQPRIV